MLARPAMTQAQSAVWAALTQAVTQYPVCEAWIALLPQLQQALPSLSAASLSQVSQMALGLCKVFGWVQGQVVQELPAVSYAATLAIAAQQFGVGVALQAINPTGAGLLALTPSALGALQALTAWDDALGLYVPANPPVTGLALVQGVSVS